MVKLVQCIARKPGMDAVEFRTHWNNYGKVLEELVRGRPNIVRYRLSTTLLVDENVRFMIDYGMPAPYDGLVEIWVEDAMLTTRNLRENPEAKAQMQKLGALLREFVDPEKSTMFYTAEEMTFDRPAGRTAAD